MEHASESGEEKRPYHSRVRQRQAEETRRRILEVARSLFESQGYAATTLEAIAELAEVSPKTIAAVFGSKRALLAEVINPEAFSTPVKLLIEELRAMKPGWHNCSSSIFFSPVVNERTLCFKEAHFPGAALS